MRQNGMDSAGYTKALKEHGWLHFYQMDAVGSGNFISPVLCRGEGIHVFDQDGRRFIDAVSGAYCVNVGYGRERILEAAMRAARQIHFVSPFSAANRPAILLAEKLSAMARPVLGDDARVYLVNSGSEAVETAVKIARAYARRTGRPDGHKIVCRDFAYHGTTLGAMSFCGFEMLRAEYGPTLPGVHHAPNTLCARCRLGLVPERCGLACADAIGKIIAAEKPETVAAVLIETTETSSGIVPPPAGYLQRVRNTCEDNGTLLIVDEVITGFGRLGQWFGTEKHGVEADILVCAKGLTSGYDSLGAVIVRKRVADVFLGGDERMFMHGATFGGRPGAAAAALETIAIMEEEDLLANARAASDHLRDLLRTEIEPLQVTGQIRHDGLLFGIDLKGRDGEALAGPEVIAQVRNALVGNGLITSLYYTRGEPVIELAPPLTVTRADCREMIDILRAALKPLA